MLGFLARQQLLEGDVATALTGEERDPEVIAFIRQKYHLDQPLPVRYAYWAGGVLRGDLGESVRLQKPVSELIVEKLPVGRGQRREVRELADQRIAG